MPRALIRLQSVKKNPDRERKVVSLLEKLKADSEKRMSIAVEVTKPPENNVRERCLLGNLARLAIKDGKLVPLMENGVRGNQIVALRLGLLLKGYCGFSPGSFPSYVDRIMSGLTERAWSLEIMIRKAEGNGKEAMEETLAMVKTERVLMERFRELGHLDSQEHADKTYKRAVRRVDEGILKVIERTEPDIIVVHRFLRDSEVPGYESFVV